MCKLEVVQDKCIEEGITKERAKAAAAAAAAAAAFAASVVAASVATAAADVGNKGMHD